MARRGLGLSVGRHIQIRGSAAGQQSTPMGAARGSVGLVGGYCDCPDSGPALDLRGGASAGGWPFDSYHHSDHVGGSPASSRQDSRRAGSRYYRSSVVSLPEQARSSPGLVNRSRTAIIGDILGRESIVVADFGLGLRLETGAAEAAGGVAVRLSHDRGRHRLHGKRCRGRRLWWRESSAA